MRQLVRHPLATFYVRIQGDSMRDAGILNGSVVLVDKAIKSANGHIAIAVRDGEFTSYNRLPRSPPLTRRQPRMLRQHRPLARCLTRLFESR